MSQSELDRPADNTGQTTRIYAVVFGVGIACSLAIVSVQEVTRPRIAANKLALRRTSILDVLPGAETIATYRFDETAGRFQTASSDASGPDLVFAGFDSQGKLVGLAIEARGMGYQDYIGLIYGYSFDKQAIIGIRVLESRETPGLGDRIESDPDFLRNFERLDVALDSAGKELAHPIEFVKAGKKTAAWQIDGITGATISSRATADMIRDSAAYWIPRVYPRRDEFQPPDGGASEKGSKSEKGSDPNSAKHPSGRSGYWGLTPFRGAKYSSVRSGYWNLTPFRGLQLVGEEA